MFLEVVGEFRSAETAISPNRPRKRLGVVHIRRVSRAGGVGKIDEKPVRVKEKRKLNGVKGFRTRIGASRTGTMRARRA